MKNTSYLNLNALHQDVMILLAKYGLNPEVVSLSMVLSVDDFEKIATNHPDHKHPGILQAGHTDPKLQWGVLIRRKMTWDEIKDNQNQDNQ